MRAVSLDYDKRIEAVYADPNHCGTYLRSTYLLEKPLYGERSGLYGDVLDELFKHHKPQAHTGDIVSWSDTNSNLIDIVEALGESRQGLKVGLLDGLITITPNGEAVVYVKAEDVVTDTRTTMKLGKYLKKLSEYKHLADEKIADIVLQTKAVLDTAGERYKIYYTETADDAEWVYEFGPSSCMKNPGSEVHPARVYAGHQICIAYMLSLDKKRCIARCVVCPDREIMATVYGNSILDDRLQELGYCGSGDWRGLVLDRVEDSRGDIVCPYLDTSQTGIDVYTDHLEIVDCNCGEYDADSTSGYLDHTVYCEYCGDHVHPDDTNYVINYGDVCGSCIEHDFTWVSIEAEYFPNSEVTYNDFSEEFELC